ncbi:chaperone DnaJ-domain superfamily protein [Actinidia rufa]|uniref:Chaperone DnaJ-domain superfamily protein n=1 Tax=Actinidia rufa TaxID=165716 RepID=A0A7J0GP95_9ERIC|nr:chaperone DnaJ-domain superfamily protein [Actinidia rufa]
MEDIGLFKQGWKWLQSKRHFYPVAGTAVICFRDKIGMFMEQHWPLVCNGCTKTFEGLALVGDLLVGTVWFGEFGHFSGWVLLHCSL